MEHCVKNGDVDCENVPQWGWLDILKNRIPPETNR